MKIGKLQIFIINLLLTIVCCIVVTYSWISINDRIDSSSMVLDIRDVSEITTISAYALKYDGVYGAVCYDIREKSYIIMTEYDRIFKDRNVNTPLIYRLEISNVATNSESYISIKIPCNQEYILETESNQKVNSFTTGYQFGTTGRFTNKSSFVIQQYISNVLRIKIGAGEHTIEPIPTDSEYIAANETVFNYQHTALNEVEDGDRSKTFVTVTDDTANSTKSFEKVSEITVTIHYEDYEEFLYDEIAEGDTLPTKHLIIYLMFDYDKSLMDDYIDSVSEGENKLFYNDLGIISIENGGI